MAACTSCAEGCRAVRTNRVAIRSIACMVSIVTCSTLPGPSPTTTIRGRSRAIVIFRSGERDHRELVGIENAEARVDVDARVAGASDEVLQKRLVRRGD